MMLTQLLGLTFVVATYSPFTFASTNLNYRKDVSTFSGIANGVPYKTTGSADEVITELQATHPSIDLFARGVLVHEGTDADKPTDFERIDKRDRLQTGFAYQNCSPMLGRRYSWPLTRNDMVTKARNILFHLPGTVSVGAQTCGLLACYELAAIHICNDLNETIDIDNKYLAEQIRTIQNDCVSGGRAFSREQVGGQNFDHDGWNMVIKNGCEDLIWGT